MKLNTSFIIQQICGFLCYDLIIRPYIACISLARDCVMFLLYGLFVVALPLLHKWRLIQELPQFINKQHPIYQHSNILLKIFKKNIFGACGCLCLLVIAACNAYTLNIPPSNALMPGFFISITWQGIYPCLLLSVFVTIMNVAFMTLTKSSECFILMSLPPGVLIFMTAILAGYQICYYLYNLIGKHDATIDNLASIMANAGYCSPYIMPKQKNIAVLAAVFSLLYKISSRFTITVFHLFILPANLLNFTANILCFALTLPAISGEKTGGIKLQILRINNNGYKILTCVYGIAAETICGTITLVIECYNIIKLLINMLIPESLQLTITDSEKYTGIAGHGLYNVMVLNNINAIIEHRQQTNELLQKAYQATLDTPTTKTNEHGLTPQTKTEHRHTHDNISTRQTKKRYRSVSLPATNEKCSYNITPNLTEESPTQRLTQQKEFHDISGEYYIASNIIEELREISECFIEQILGERYK